MGDGTGWVCSGYRDDLDVSVSHGFGCITQLRYFFLVGVRAWSRMDGVFGDEEIGC